MRSLIAANLMWLVLLGGCNQTVFEDAYVEGVYSPDPSQPASGAWVGSWHFVGSPSEEGTSDLKVLGAVVRDERGRWQMNLDLHLPPTLIDADFPMASLPPASPPAPARVDRDRNVKEADPPPRPYDAAPPMFPSDAPPGDIDWVQAPIEIRRLADGSESLGGKGCDHREIYTNIETPNIASAELFGTIRGDNMHITISFYDDATYLGPRTPYATGEIDLVRVRLPWMGRTVPTTLPANPAMSKTAPSP